MNNLLKVTAITGGSNEPSARFRVRQYIHELAKFNIQVTEYLPFIAKSGHYWYHKYPFPIQFIPQIGTASLRLTSRAPAIIASYKSDITWIQREFLTACATTECCTKRPRLFDVDDAIWLRLKLTSGFAKKIVRNMDGLICGNRWIADYFADCNVPIWVVPTGIDTIRWHPATTKQRKPFYFGWIGTSGNYKYLYDIEQAFYTFFNKFPQAKLLIVAERRPNFLYLSKKNIHFVRWSKTNEVQAVQQMNVGLMPLRNTDWERGKCAFKMLVYMAVGIPVIVSPIGMNNEILSKGTIGFGPVSHSDWIDSLMILYQNSTMRKQMGETGRKIVEDYYSTTITTEQLSNIFHKVS